MPGTGLSWTAPEPPPAPLPYGWTDADLATLANMAQEFGIAPIEIMALFYSESALNPKASGLGLAGLTSVVETEMGWPAGTVHQLNTGPITAYLQAVFQLWTHLEEKYIRKSFPAKAAEWGVSPGTVLYVFHGFLGPALSAHGPTAILGRRPPVWPVTWANGGWSYQGAPVAQSLGRSLTGPEVLYSGNAGLDHGNKGTITIADMAYRVASKAKALQLDPHTAPLYRRLQSFETLPTGEVPPLTSLFGAIAPIWKKLTGGNVRTSAPTLAGEAPHGTPATPIGGPEASASGSGPAATIAVAAGLAGLAWYFLRREGKK